MVYMVYIDGIDGLYTWYRIVYIDGIDGYIDGIGWLILMV